MRTKWPSRKNNKDHKNGNLEDSVNISSVLPVTELPESLAGIKEVLEKIEQKIDRINISADIGNWRSVFEDFNKHLHLLSVRRFKNNKGTAWTFVNECGDKVQLVKRQNPENGKIKWFNVSLLQPSQTTQYRIRDLLAETITASSYGHSIFSLSEIEFALDFYPKENNDLLMLSKILVDHVVLKHSHGDSVRWYEGTFYQGRGGNVRTGSKGLRCYLKPEDAPPEFFRIELQVNRRFIREKKIMDALPVFPGAVDVFDYVDFREGLNSARLDKLTDSICSTLRPTRKRHSRSMAHNVIKHSVRSMILNGIREPRLYPFVFDNPDRVTVAEQIVSFKKWKKRYGLKLRKPKVFPPTV